MSLSDDCRARCPKCRGTGVWDQAEWIIGACDDCCSIHVQMPCAVHRCRLCDGSGLVCPVCQGARFVRQDVPIGHPDFGQALRCTSCCEGNQVNMEKERGAIQRYLSRF